MESPEEDLLSIFFVFEALKKEIERGLKYENLGAAIIEHSFFQHFTAFDSGISELSHGGTQKRQIEKQHHGGNEKVMRHTTGLKKKKSPVQSVNCESD